MCVVTLGANVDLAEDHQHYEVHDLVGIEPVVERARLTAVIGVQGGKPSLRYPGGIYAGCRHAQHLYHARLRQNDIYLQVTGT